MTTKKLTKAEMIKEIIELCKSSSRIHNLFFDGADVFFTLAFRTDSELKKLCKQLNIKTN